jgi:hypothetical protein
MREAQQEESSEVSQVGFDELQELSRPASL